MKGAMHALVGSYALGALTDLEAEGFLAHLAGCPACADELFRLATAVEAIAALGGEVDGLAQLEWPAKPIRGPE